MADPIIMAFARGILREFPGDPESIVDFVPVDHVVNALISAVARGISVRPAEPEVYQVASGQRNPIRYREFYEHVREFFLPHHPKLPTRLRPKLPRKPPALWMPPRPPVPPHQEMQPRPWGPDARRSANALPVSPPG